MGKINGSNICPKSGDYILRSRYMNLRINDILPDAEPINKEKLLPPIITPESQTYDVADTATWGDITIKNINPTGLSSTNYNIQVFDAKNKLVKEITEDCSFSTDSLVLTWDGDKLAAVKGIIQAGYSVRVNAKCYITDENYSSPSTATSQIYYFKHLTHKVKIVAMPFANSGDPTISIEGSRAEKDTWLTVGEGDNITLYGGYGNEPFHFTCFSTDSKNKSEFNSDFTPTKVTDNQYTVTIPNGYNGEGITFYAWYASPAIGVKTRVNTNYYNSEADDEQWIDGKLTLIHKYEFTDWCNNENYINLYTWGSAKAPAGVGKPQFPSFVDDDTDYSKLNFADGEVTDATANKDLNYPTGSDESKSYREHGLDLTARIMSDNTTMLNYNAIVMVKSDNTYMTTTDFEENTTNNATVQKAQSLKAARSSYFYYLVNGYAYPFNTEGTIAQNAQGIKHWYTSVDAVLPEVSEAMAFNNAIDKTSSETPKYYVVFFIVNKNTLPSIQNLIDGKDYIFKVEHPIIPNATMTGVDVNKVANGLLIVGKQGCATFVSNAEQMVRVFNILGQQVAAFNLNGSHTVELPQGIYVANGQKFIVK